MTFKEIFYPESRFGGFSDIDGTIAFFQRINSLIDETSTVLDVGCGAGSYGNDPLPWRKNLRILRGKAGRVIGIDVDENARNNPFLDEFRLIKDDAWPVESDSIDLLVCDNVLEHIKEPELFFAQIQRVLKNGGILCVRTPNRWNYIAIAATLIPNKAHAKVLSVVQDGRKEEDVFPTFYRCNTVGKLKKIMKKNGFSSVVYGYEAEPGYLSFSLIAYFLGVLHQRLAPGFFKAAIFAFGTIQKDKTPL